MIAAHHFGIPTLITYIFGFAVATVFYVLPSMIARQRDVAHRGWLIVINVFLGFTIIGWVITMIWAVFGPTKKKRKSFWESYYAARATISTDPHDRLNTGSNL